MQPWFTVYFFDIEHPCYDHWHLSKQGIRSITCPYRGLKCTAHLNHVFFWKLTALTKCWFSIGSQAHVRLVQSLNSPFFPPHIGAEPGRAKEESRITCMRMLRTPQFFTPNRGENHIWKYFPDLACGSCLWRDFLNDNIQATISAFRLIKTMSINPKSVEFHQ